jgi:hypothetical protein
VVYALSPTRSVAARKWPRAGLPPPSAESDWIAAPGHCHPPGLCLIPRSNDILFEFGVRYGQLVAKVSNHLPVFLVTLQSSRPAFRVTRDLLYMRGKIYLVRYQAVEEYVRWQCVGIVVKQVDQGAFEVVIGMFEFERSFR